MISYDANKFQYMAFGSYFFWIFQSGLLLEKSILFIFFFFAYYCLGVKLSKKTSGAKISVQKKITRSGPLENEIPIRTSSKKALYSIFSTLVLPNRYYLMGKFQLCSRFQAIKYHCNKRSIERFIGLRKSRRKTYASMHSSDFRQI